MPPTHVTAWAGCVAHLDGGVSSVGRLPVDGLVGGDGQPLEHLLLQAAGGQKDGDIKGAGSGLEPGHVRVWVQGAAE